MQDERLANADASNAARRPFRGLLLGAIGLSGAALLLAVATIAPSSWNGRIATAIPARPEAEVGGMVWIPGGRFLRWLEESPDARPVRQVEVDGFWIDRTEVTNAGYLAGARGKGDPSSAASHTGFRCVRSGDCPDPSKADKDNRK
jgi:formylglycine-generating enzyme required for sulfatase activity